MTDAFLANTDVTKLDEVYYDMRGNVAATILFIALQEYELNQSARKA